MFIAKHFYKYDHETLCFYMWDLEGLISQVGFRWFPIGSIIDCIYLSYSNVAQEPPRPYPTMLGGVYSYDQWQRGNKVMLGILKGLNTC